MNICRQHRPIFIFLSLLIWSCASAPVETTESSPPDILAGRVLIVTQRTEFKQEVVSEIRKGLNRNSIYSKTVDLKNLRYQNTDAFSAIIIINRAMAGRPDPRVESYIDYEPQKHKLIILTTGMLDAWKPDTEGVDAITSASAKNKSDQVAKMIVSKVLALLEQTKSQ